jgi:hypothetical protein
MWIASSSEGYNCDGTFEGTTLLDAIIEYWKENNKAIMWDDRCFEDMDLTIEEKGKFVIQSIEDSYAGKNSYQIIVWDITEFGNHVILFPISQRPPNFNSEVLGIKYIIQSWIPAECEDPDTYDSLEAAESELMQLQEMQPENRYEIQEIRKS